MLRPVSARATPRSIRSAANSPVARLSAAVAASERSPDRLPSRTADDVGDRVVDRAPRRRREEIAVRGQARRASPPRAGRPRPEPRRERARRCRPRHARSDSCSIRAISAVGQARTDGFTIDRRLDPRGLLARGYRQQAVGVDLERRPRPARRAGGHRRNAAQLEAARASGSPRPSRARPARRGSRSRSGRP